MPDRLLLVIGSQCKELQPPLTFLPQAATALFEVLTDPERGGCRPVRAGRGLLLDPTGARLIRTVHAAFEEAGESGAVLVLAYIGHGQMLGDEFFLLPVDGRHPPLEFLGGVNIVQLVKNLMARSPRHPAGMLVLLDACYAGIAAAGAAARWSSILPGSMRFELLAAAGDRRAFSGCFTQTLTRIIREGLDEVDAAVLHPRHVIQELRKRCPKQVPQHPAFNAHDDLFLATNQAWDESRRLPAIIAGEVARLTTAFHPTSALSTIVHALDAARVLAIVGPTGSGKSTALAALARPKVTQGRVRRGFLHALLLGAGSTTPDALAHDLADQLARSVPGFREARAQWEDVLIAPGAVPVFERHVLAPLRLVAPVPVRIGFDDVDQLSTGAGALVQEAIREIGRAPELAHVRVVMTSLPGGEVPRDAQLLMLPPAESGDLRAWLAERRVAGTHIRSIVARAKGNWLVARMLADAADARLNAPVDGEADADGDPGGATPDAPRAIAVPKSLSAAYSQMLLRIEDEVGAARWQAELAPLLRLLAVTCSGPVMPLSLLAEASALCGGPTDPAVIDSALAAMRHIVVRGRTDVGVETVGLFHDTLGEHLLDPRFPHVQADREGAVRALLAAMARLAPASPRRVHDPVYRYAIAREAELCWSIEDYDALCASLEQRQCVLPRLDQRESEVPKDTLIALGEWKARLRTRLPADDRRLLALDSLALHVLGETGEAAQAYERLTELLARQEQAFGPLDPDVLRTRGRVAHWVGRRGQPGDLAKAVEAFEALLPLREQALGPRHRETLDARAQIAFWIGVQGGAEHVSRAREAFESLVTIYEQALGAEHDETLTVRANLAHWTGASGNAQSALAQIQALLPVLERTKGAAHPETLRNRSNEAFYLDKVGRQAEALERFRGLVDAVTEVLGKNVDLTLAVSMHLARLTGKEGQPEEARRRFTEAVERTTRLFGASHPYTWFARRGLAEWTVRSGQREAGFVLLDALESDALAAGAERELTLIRQLSADLRRPPDLPSSPNLPNLSDVPNRPEERSMGAEHPPGPPAPAAPPQSPVRSASS